MEDEHLFSATPRRYRTCSDCHTALSLMQGAGASGSGGGAASVLSPQAFFPASPSLGSVTPSEAAASDVSELVECPVCGTTLASVGGKGEQEQHIRDCLDTGGGTVSSGRYLGASLSLSLSVSHSNEANSSTLSRSIQAPTRSARRPRVRRLLRRLCGRRHDLEARVPVHLPPALHRRLALARALVPCPPEPPRAVDLLARPLPSPSLPARTLSFCLPYRLASHRTLAATSFLASA